MRKSKRSTELVINTKKKKPESPQWPFVKSTKGIGLRRRRARGGGLTLLILAVNIVPLLVLVVGVLSLGQYRDNLINENLKTLRERAQNYATAVAEGAVRPVQQGRPFMFAQPQEIEMLIPELSRRMVRRLGEAETSNNLRIRLFDLEGYLTADSHKLTGPGGVVQIVPLQAPDSAQPGFFSMVAHLGVETLALLPLQSGLPLYKPPDSSDISDYHDARTVKNTTRLQASAWEDRNGNIILTAAAPVQKAGQQMGVILLTDRGHDIEAGMARVRFDVLTAALAALSLTFFLSVYLAGTIGRPLKKLAQAAEAVRQSKGRYIDIPDLSHRRDEIGELSLSLHEMMQALRDRMDMIERFAADVAHEIKNPLTSLRSAVETVAKVKDPDDREKLMAIIQHDVQRLDRLISDISSASRLDAELSRDEMGIVDLSALLGKLVDAKRTPLERTARCPESARAGSAADGTQNIQFKLPPEKPLYVRGNESRLAQVFENLIGNALSFSPPDKAVTITAREAGGQIQIEIRDRGPGIPENKREAIFERFYSERPAHEDYGSHSGLGLSIARQIITAHNGTITAENVNDDGGAVSGACFTVILPEA